MLQRIRHRRPAFFSPEIIAAALLLAGGAALRLYALGEIPPGLHQDEAPAGYDAWSLLNFGIDRNGFSWPVHFVNWGGGQSALYSYLAMPFIAMGGLTATVFRLPMALTGLLSLFLIWKIGENADGRPFALLVLLLLALNSWHLMASRWGLDANLLPFVLLLSVYFLSREDRGRLHIQAIAVAVLALSVYAYSLAYAFAPLFLGLVLGWLWLNQLADWRRLLALAALAGIVALPIILLVVINFFDLDTVSVLGVSIPRYTGPARYAGESLLLSGDWGDFFVNTGQLAALLLGWGDGRVDNGLPGFGALPPFAILLSLVGLGAVLYRAKAHREYGVHLLVAGWFAAALLVALITQVQIHRINALWLPAIYLMAVGAFFIGRNRRVILYALVAAYVSYSGLFVYQYFRDYADLAGGIYRSGLAAALERAVAAAGDEVIYVSHRRYYPAAYALFYTKPTPQEYLDTRMVAWPNSEFHFPVLFGQFVFTSPLSARDAHNLYRQVARQALQDSGIDLKPVAHYVLAAKEAADLDTSRLILERYGDYYYAYDPALIAGGAARTPLLRNARPPVSGEPATRAKFNIYWDGNALTYYKEGCDAYDTRQPFFLHITPANAADLPPEGRALGFANRDFRFGRYGALYGRNCWAVVPLPDYPIAVIKTGQFVDGKGELWRAEFPVGEQ